MILDIILAAFVILIAVIGYKRGIVKTIYNLAGVALAGVAAYLGGKLIAEFVYNNFILSSITQSVKTSFESSGVNSSGVSGSIFDGIPQIFAYVLNLFGVTVKSFTTSLDKVNVLSEKATLTVVDNVISPLIISVISVAFIILLFIILLFILKFLGRYILKIFKLPVIRWINAVLGGFLGFAEGLLLSVAIILILRIILSCADNPFISQEMINSSYIFKSVYYCDFINLFSNLTGL